MSDDGLVTVVGALASSWGVIMAFAPVLQIVRIVRQKSSKDVSLAYFAVLIPGFALWVLYGSVAGDAFVVIPNVIAVLTAAMLIAVVVVVRRRSSR